MQRARLSRLDEFNTADAVDFQYKLVMPEVMPEPPKVNNILIASTNLNSYTQKLMELEHTRKEPQTTDDILDTMTEEESIILEDEDESYGDFDIANQIPPWTDGQ
jgi:hypothetical protein